MSQPTVKIGQTYDALFVVQQLPTRKHRTWWRCRCVCGNSVEARGRDLIRKHRTSCGCKKFERMKKTMAKRYEGSFGGMSATLSRYKNQAKSRGIFWNLSKEQCIELFKTNCFYCNKPPSAVCIPVNGRKTKFYYNGIDRWDSNLGYTPENVVACCGQCNRAKSNTPPLEFLLWIERVYKWVFKKRILV